MTQNSENKCQEQHNNFTIILNFSESQYPVLENGIHLLIYVYFDNL